MLGEAVKEVAKGLNDLLNEEDGPGDPFLSSHNYRVRPFSLENFKPIKPVESHRKIGFVDGGNLPLLEAPNFAVELNRVYFGVFEGRKRAPQISLSQRVEFFSVTVAKFRKEQIFYDTTVFPVSDDLVGLIPLSTDLSFSSVDRRLMAGGARADIGRVVSIARRFAEWEFARHVIERELDRGDFLVMDGTLRTAFPNESKYARAAYSAANAKGVIYTGLSKTSHMFTTTGLSLLGALRKMAIDNKIGPIWYYYPIAESISPEHEAAIFVVKLNNQSQRIFRYEIQGGQMKVLTAPEINEILSQLSINSSSLEFPGYPYGLVDADDNARVRYQEVGAYRVMLLSEISKLGASSKFMRHMESIDAHDVLETMREVSSSLTTCGQIVAGEVGKILIREKSGEKIELGDLLAVDDSEGFLLIQVYNLLYGSQISRLWREQMAGLKLEGLGTGLEFFEPQLRNYILAEGKSVLRVTNKVQSPKILPDFFGTVRHAEKKDLQFLGKPANPMYLGQVRSGSKVIDVPVYLDAGEALVHHILIASTTGRGKSNLVKVMLWGIVGGTKSGILVLDAHDEYYGRSAKGLKDHPKARGNVLYYSVNPTPGTSTLSINLRSISPEHLEGIITLTEAQEQAVRMYYQEYHEEWIENILRGSQVEHVRSATLSVLQRMIRTKLSTRIQDGEIVSRNRVFSDTSGASTIKSIVDALEDGKIVIIDTSKIGDEAELLIGSMVANDAFTKYQNYKAEGVLTEKLPISIVIEEAPRVLGSDKLAFGDNIYSKIAKEGRKFKIGLQAITQLTSVIPRDILTNINTKIILGNEMATERRAIIDSASQDLSEDDRTIASLDKGEAIVTSIFTKFAVPIQIPLFEDLVKEQRTAPGLEGSLEYSG